MKNNDYKAPPEPPPPDPWWFLVSDIVCFVLFIASITWFAHSLVKLIRGE